MLITRRFVFNPFMENTYVVWDEESRETAIIDPGCAEENEFNQIDKYIDENRLEVKYILNTHCHIDHVLGNAYLKRKYNAELLAPEKDLFLLKNIVEQGKQFGIEVEQSPEPDTLIAGNGSLYLGDKEGRYFLTPGHSPGEYSLYFPEPRYCYTGDVLFRDGIGRTDLWQGDYDKLIASIKSKLFILPEETKVFPGHGDESTIGYEKVHNPFLI